MLAERAKVQRTFRLPEAEDFELFGLLPVFHLAVGLHQGQSRWGFEDYIRHPIRVATLVAKSGGTDNAVLAAILHDTLEDTYATEELLLKYVSDEVLEIVKLLTKGDGEENAVYLDRLIRSGNRDAIMVKWADATDNSTLQPEAVSYLNENGVDPDTVAKKYRNVADMLLPHLTK